MTKQGLFFLVAAALLSSCTVTKMARYNEVAYRNLEPKQDAVIVPLKGEIEVLADKDGTYTRIAGATKRSGTDLMNGVVVYPLEETLLPYEIQEWKKRAVNEVAKAYEADLIVGALVDVEYAENVKIDKRDKDVKCILTVKISGYPARFKGFRNLDVSDPSVLEYYMQTTNRGDAANQRRHEEGVR